MPVNKTYQAFEEGKRILNLCAFNIQGAIKKRKINQYKTVYYFPDNSKLSIFPAHSMAISESPFNVSDNASFLLKINK